MFYSIGEMAKKLGVPTSTLRFYDKKGLLPFVERTSGGIRRFTNKDYEFLQIVECLKKSGMSLKEINLFIQMVMKGDETMDERLELFKRRKKEVEKQILDLQRTLDTINYKCWYYETAKAAGTTTIHDNMTIEDLPEEFHDVKKWLAEN